MAITYNTIEEALQDLRNGKCILVTDDPDRENEGDLICAGQFATTENVNLMASAAKGLICMPMNHDNIVRLGLTQMVSHNTDNHETAFTVSIDHIDTTTGISAVERGLTARMAADPEAHPGDFRRPGHMFPLEAKPGGVLERNGHTEATVDLLRLAGLTQVGLCCEIMDDDGTMMRGEKLADLEVFHPDRMASRILGMGDVLTLIEDAQTKLDEKAAQKTAQRLMQNKMDLNDLLEQFQQVKKMGPIKGILSKLPGVGNKLDDVDIDDRVMDRSAAIILSMTPYERSHPDCLNASRKKRIAAGCGMKVEDVNRLLNQFRQTQKMLKQFGGLGKGKRRRMPNLPM